MRYFKLVLAFFILSISLLTSCQYRSNRKQIEYLARALAEQQTDSAKIAKQQYAQQQTARLDSLRGYSLEESKSNSAKIDYNTGVAIVIILGVLFFGFLIFRFVKGVKKGLKDISYATGDMKKIGQDILNDPEKLSKMSPEEREQLDKMMNFLEKKGKNSKTGK